MTVAGQPVVSYTFDDADRLTQILKGTDVVHFVYDNSGRRTSTTLPNGTLATYLYDLSSRLTGINYQRGGSTLGDLTYQYDGAGRRSSMTGSFASVNLPSAIPSATYNANNQLTNWNGTERTYDPNGNLINDGTRTYAWNARNQLSSVGAFEFQYDGFGRRIGNGAGLNFLYDGVNPIQELAGGVPSANMLSGGVDEVFLRSGINGNWNLLSNGLGSTLGLSDTGGNVQTQYTYEPFGKTTITGTPNANSIQFTGRELDADGLYYYRARYYDPAIGRFLSEDPIRFDGGNNFYVYAQNNPIELTDPFGLKCKPKCFAQLKYRRAKFGENHSFWWVQDSNGDQWVISGGPTEVFGAPGTGYLNVWVVPGSTGHYPADNAGAAVAFDSGLSEQVCRQVDQMLQHARQWPNNQIYYGSNNSNTVAHDIGNAGSFNPPQPPRTPGW
jgi:RHS repeat-associated protein